MYNQVMKYNYKRIVSGIMKILTNGCVNGSTVQMVSDKLRAYLNSIEDINRNEKFALYSPAMDIYRKIRHGKNDPNVWSQILLRRDTFDSIHTTARKVMAKVNLRKKKSMVRAALKSNEVVFFLCSSHVNPAKDHARFQGLLFYDKFWRTKISGELYYPILSYIKNHRLISVQEIMGEPVYLTTRPYCKHYFIPVETKLVLKSSVNKIRREMHIGTDRDKLYSPAEYFDTRAGVYDEMLSIIARSKKSQHLDQASANVKKAIKKIIKKI